MDYEKPDVYQLAPRILHIPVKTPRRIYIGIVIVIVTFVFDLVWFNTYIQNNDEVYYTISVKPSVNNEYEIIFPTLINGNGQETSFAQLIKTSDNIKPDHIIAFP
jgi:hypothetical protein